jgi:hypothetical protein
MIAPLTRFATIAPNVTDDQANRGESIADNFRWSLLQSKAHEQRIGRAFSLFREAGIEPVIIKGWAAASFYPKDRVRLATDTDLAVAAADFERAWQIAESEAAVGLAIDLHRELRHLDTVGWADLFANSQTVETEFGQFRILRPEDHLRVLCVHWLTDGGSSRERLWDIYYAVANRGADFDWDRFLGVVSAVRQRWMICTLGLARHFLGLDLTDTPIESEAADLPPWLIRTCQREMASEVKFLPLHIVVREPKMLVQQIRKRLRPNPIWATVETEGSFDAKTRFFYEVRHTLSRIAPSFRRVSGAIRAK